MSVVIERDHPSGKVGISVGHFPDDGTVLLGIGALKDMTFFTLAPREAELVASALLVHAASV